MRLNRGLPKKSPLDDYRLKYDPVVLYPFDPSGRDKKLDAPKFATIDIETQDWVNFVCGEVYWIDSKGREQAFETNNLFDLMLKCFEIAATEGIKNFVAHYGGKFDFLFFIKELLMSNECIIENIMPRGSSLLSFQAELCKTGKRQVSFELPQKITFRDSSALLPFSLGSLTKSFNVETLKGEMDFLFVEQVYNEVDYLDDIINDDRCILFYHGKQIHKVTKDHRRRIDKLRYLNLDRFPLYYYRGKVSYVKPHKYSDKWFKDLTYPIFKKEDLLLYLHHDCKSLYQCIDAFFNAPLIRNAKKKWTTASQSVEVFRLFMKKRLHSLPDDDTFCIESDVDSFVRQAYFGGRTEIFKPVFDADINEADFLYYYDVNSLYPFCMRDHKYPDKFLGWSKSKAEYNKYDMSIWHCKVKVPESLYAPPLPVKKDERLIFPVGEFTGYWTKYELEYAKTLGCEIIELYEGAIFSDAGYIFKDFIKKLYQMRLDAKEKNDNVTQMTMKLIMNSCYGRMGINKERSKIVFDDGSDHTVTLISEIETPRGWIRLATKPEKSEKMFSNPAIACFVTSYARVYLHTKFREVGEKHIYYGDSVTKDRMIFVKKNNILKVISFEELWSESSNKQTRGEKEIAFSDYKTISWCPVKKKIEWKKINEVIRHKTNKKIYEVFSSSGRTCVTEDHSLIDEFNNKVQPCDLKYLFSPKNKLSELEIDDFETVDMNEYMKCLDFKDFERAKNRSTQYTALDDWLCFTYEHGDNSKVPMIKRHWSKDEIFNFLPFLSFFIGDGSVSTPHTTQSRYMMAINSEKKDKLEEMQKFLISMTKNVSFNIIKSSKNDKTYKLSSGTKIMAYFMKSLIGQSAKGKRLPNFIFSLPLEAKENFLKGLMWGDGSRINDKKYSEQYRNKNFSYCTQSPYLANQLSILFGMMGHSFGFSYREGKSLYTIRTCSKNKPNKPTVKEIQYDDYVYDVSIDKNENFFDCMGVVGLHNTDSVFTDVPMNTGKELGAMKLEYKCTSACFLLPKTYVNEGIIEDNGLTKPLKITMKGFDFKNIRNAFTFEDFFEYLNGDLGNIFVTEKAKFATFKTALKMGKFVAMKNDPVSKRESDVQKEEDHFKKTGKKKKFTKDEYKVSVKKLQGYYGKRTITNNGFDTEPLKVYE